MLLPHRLFIKASSLFLKLCRLNEVFIAIRRNVMIYVDIYSCFECHCQLERNKSSYGSIISNCRMCPRCNRDCTMFVAVFQFPPQEYPSVFSSASICNSLPCRSCMVRSVLVCKQEKQAILRELRERVLPRATLQQYRLQSETSSWPGPLLELWY